MIGEFVMRCFHARTNAHILHLKTRSYATHMALGEFYDGIVDLADSVAEMYQGEHGVITDYPTRYKPCESPVECIEELKEWIEQHRYDAVEAEDTFIHNVIDEIIALCASTIYKIKVLK